MRYSGFWLFLFSCSPAETTPFPPAGHPPAQVVTVRPAQPDQPESSEPEEWEIPRTIRGAARTKEHRAIVKAAAALLHASQATGQRHHWRETVAEQEACENFSKLQDPKVVDLAARAIVLDPEDGELERALSSLRNCTACIRESCETTQVALARSTAK